MSAWFEIKTEATIEDVSGSTRLEILPKSESKNYILVDKFGNENYCATDQKGRIIGLERIYWNFVNEMLYVLVVEYDSLFYTEDTFQEMLQNTNKGAAGGYLSVDFLPFENNTCKFLKAVLSDSYIMDYDKDRVKSRLTVIENKLFNRDNNYNKN